MPVSCCRKNFIRGGNAFVVDECNAYLLRRKKVEKE
jgi:hypothetical protein